MATMKLFLLSDRSGAMRGVACVAGPRLMLRWLFLLSLCSTTRAIIGVKAFVWALLVISFVVLCVAFGFLVYMNTTVVKATETLHFDALHDSVTVTREDSGMVHIAASNDHDLYFAQVGVLWMCRVV